MFSFQGMGGIVGCLGLLVLPLFASSLRAQKASELSPGIAWQVRGLWRVEGKSAPILTGDAVEPRSLLQPGKGTADHSMNVLLPDGQRVLYECFTAEDCARGFRVPSLYRTPEPFAVDMLARIQAVLARGSRDVSTPKASLPCDEVVAVFGSGNRVQIAGLAAKLPNGRYTYDLRSLDRAYPRQSHLVFEKNAPFIALALPSPGLYVLTISDDLNTPRIDLFIAAVTPAQAENIGKSSHKAKALLEQWNEEYFGWPVHDFQRAYLASLMLDVKPLDHATGGQVAADEMHSVGVTAEPTFSPRPGLFDRGTAVALRCATSGATLHFTVNGSQPSARSPVYGAPIIVTGTELTVKSFASAPGKKDSAVVTGIYRIRQ